MIMMILQDVFPLQRWSWSHWRLHRHRLDAWEDEAGHQRWHHMITFVNIINVIIFVVNCHQHDEMMSRRKLWTSTGTSHVCEHRGTIWWVFDSCHGKLENVHHDKEDIWPFYIEVHFTYIDLLGSNWGSIHLYPRRPIRGEHILSILVKKKSHGQFKDCRVPHPTL